MANMTAVPTLLTDPGFLFYAPVGTTEPANTVLASKFSDPWPVAWVNLGATMDGSEFSYATTVSPIHVSEFLDPIRQVPTGRMGKVTFALASYTATNLKFALNGGITTVTGTTATTLTKVNPPIPGQEVRTMIGWE